MSLVYCVVTDVVFFVCVYELAVWLLLPPLGDWPVFLRIKLFKMRIAFGVCRWHLFCSFLVNGKLLLFLFEPFKVWVISVHHFFSLVPFIGFWFHGIYDFKWHIRHTLMSITYLCS